MAEELVKAENADEEEYSKPNPKINPRNISLGEIAKTVAEQHAVEFAETAPTVDEDNQPTEPPPATPEEPAPAVEEPPSEESTAPPVSPPMVEADVAAPREAIDPAKEYEVTIDGQKLKVPGQKIIDAGFRTFQKETAADYRLQVATDLLRKAEEQARTTTQQSVEVAAPAQQIAEATDAELANAIQYGSQEQAAQAISEMRKRDKVDPAQIANFATAQVRNEIAFQEGLKFVQTEYADLLANDHIRRLFFVEENRRRAPKARGGEGDQRTHKDMYQAIGEELRKSLNRPKPATGTTQSSPTATVAVTAASRQERKAAVPSVPRTAAGRLAAASDAPKAKTTSEIISQMAARRGQGNLNRQPNKE